MPHYIHTGSPLDVLHLLAEHKGWRVPLHTEPVPERPARPCTLELVEHADRKDIVARQDVTGLTVNEGARLILAGLKRAGLIP